MQYQLLLLRKYYKIQDMKEGKTHVLLPLPTSLPVPHWTKTYISRAFLFSIWLTAKPNPNTEKDKCKRCPDFQFSLFIFSSIWENNRKSVFILVEPSLRKILLTDVYAANKQRRQKNTIVWYQVCWQPLRPIPWSSWWHFCGPRYQNKVSAHQRLILCYIWVSEKWKLLYKVTGLKIFFFFKTVSILCKIFWEKLKNQAKFDTTKNLWYLFKGIFWAPVHKIYFYGAYRTLGCVPMQFGDFVNIDVPP